MSVPDADGTVALEEGIELIEYRSDVIEITARPGRNRELEGVAAARGLTLPGFSRVVSTARWLTMSVRPERWLVLQASTPGGARAAQWQSACTGIATVVDLSSALALLHLSGPMARELLARSCRVDLHESGLPTGRAIATIMAQTAVVIAAIPAGLLVLTPSTTARHFREWLLESARACALVPQSAGAMIEMFGGSAQ